MRICDLDDIELVELMVIPDDGQSANALQEVMASAKVRSYKGQETDLEDLDKNKEFGVVQIHRVSLRYTLRNRLNEIQAGDRRMVAYSKFNFILQTRHSLSRSSPRNDGLAVNF